MLRASCARQQQHHARRRRLLLRRPSRAPAPPGAAPAGLARAAAPGLEPAPRLAPTQRHFLHLDDLSRTELDAVLARAGQLKAAFRAGDATYQPLRGRTMSMIFAKPSLRTRVSFEAARGPPPPAAAGGRERAVRPAAAAAASDPRHPPPPRASRS